MPMGVGETVQPYDGNQLKGFLTDREFGVEGAPSPFMTITG